MLMGGGGLKHLLTKVSGPTFGGKEVGMDKIDDGTKESRQEYFAVATF